MWLTEEEYENRSRLFIPLSDGIELYLEWWENGILFKKGYYKGEVRHGKFTTYSNNGELWEKSRYVNGVSDELNFLLKD